MMRERIATEREVCRRTEKTTTRRTTINDENRRGKGKFEYEVGRRDISPVRREGRRWWEEEEGGIKETVL